jgi:hypothetical protein
MMSENSEWALREDAEDIAQEALTTAYCKLRIVRIT